MPKPKVTLKPCPFCGFAPKGILIDTRPIAIRERVEGMVIICPECQAKGPLGKTGQLAVDGWNRRLIRESKVKPCIAEHGR